MKHTKTTLSLLLVLVMLLTLTTTAFATETPDPAPANPGTPDPALGNTITVNNAQKEETYNIYKMLDLIVDLDKDAYTYTVNESWTNFFTGSGAGKDYVSISNPGGYVTWVDEKNTPEAMIAFGKAAAEFAKKAENNVPTASTADQSPAEDGGSITFSNLDPGYYLITSTNGTNVIIRTTPAEPNPIVNEKNKNPTINKQVQEAAGWDAVAEDAGWGKVNDAQIGQVIKFKTEVTAQSGAKGYIVHDAMDPGLNFINDATYPLTIKVGNDTLRAKTTDGETANALSTEHPNGYQYEVITPDSAEGCDFHIEFVQAYLDTLTDDTKITITYHATLDANTVVPGTGYINKTWLAWSNSETEKVTTTTYTWQADVLKYGNGDKTKVLKDAQFVLLSPDGNKVALFDANGKITAWADTPAAGADGKRAWTQEMIQTTNDSGKILIQGLDSGVAYKLREVQAPAGYNLLGADKEVNIQRSETSTANALSQKALTVEVNNQSGNVLPETGGIGTTIFYVVGSILFLGAAVLLVTKRRMQAE